MQKQKVGLQELVGKITDPYKYNEFMRDKLNDLFGFDDDQDGRRTRRVARTTLDASAGLAIGEVKLGVDLPQGAIVMRSYYKVLTTFTSATDAATIALGSEASGDLVAAIAISNVADAWDAGLHEGIQDDTVVNAVELSAEKEMAADVAVEDLTAGKLVLFAEYVVA